MLDCSTASQNFIAADQCRAVITDFAAQAAFLPCVVVVAVIIAAVFATLVIKAGF